MNHDIFAGHWKQMRGTLKSWWGKLSDDDFEWIEGQKDKLIGLVQEKYGFTRGQAREEVDRRFNEYDDKDSTASVRDMTAKVYELGKTAASKARGAVTALAMNLQRRGLPYEKTNWRLWLQTSTHLFANTRSHCYSLESAWATYFSAREMTSRLLKKTHMLRCAQSPRYNVLIKYASARRFFARLASEIFLSSLRTEFFSNLLGIRRLRIKSRTAHDLTVPENSIAMQQKWGSHAQTNDQLRC